MKDVFMTVKEKIEKLLSENFDIIDLDVIDESHKHIGHAGYREGGETHFHVVLKSSDFKGMTRVAQQRSVYKALETLMDKPIHALSLDISVP